jgi:prepilin-type processing-associated H-X9-DG protein
MDKDYYSRDEEDLDDDFEYDASGAKLSKILLIFLVLGISGFCACGILSTFLAPSLYSATEKSNKQKCANNLKGIGIALILYSNDYRFFPHMQSLNAPNKSTDVAKVYRTLIYFNYIDNAELYTCPSSEDFFIQPTQAMIDNPKIFGWKGVVADGRKPIHSGPGPELFTDPDFLELSYTYLRRSVNASAVRSDTIMAADKAITEDFDHLDNSTDPVGNHSDGFNILYGDGHVNFVSEYEEKVMTRMARRLHMGAFDPSLRSGK